MNSTIADKTQNFSVLSGVATPVSFVTFWNENLNKRYVNASASIVSTANLALSFLEAKNITVENQIKAEDFLTKHQTIIPHLYDAPNIISQYFPNSSIVLSVFSDPDNEADFSELFFEVETNLSPIDANHILSSLNREWLIRNQDQDLALLNVTLKFS